MKGDETVHFFTSDPLPGNDSYREAATGRAAPTSPIRKTHRTETVQNEISRDSQVQPLYKDGRENKSVKDRRSLEGLFNFTFQSFLAGKYLSSTNEPGHIRNRLSTALLYSESISPCESYSDRVL